MTALQIRPMTADDVASVVAVYDAGGWPNRDAYLRWIMTVPTCRLIVGALDGRIVATGLATIDGPVGWVGSIFVARDLRSRGYGRTITEAVCDLIDAAGCRTQALMASPLGRPLYVEMGFRVDDEYRLYVPSDAQDEAGGAARGAGGAPATGAAACRPMRPADLDAVFALDRAATGEDRSALITSLAGGGWVAETDGEVSGFLVKALSDGGALIASTPEAAAGLLDTLRRGAAPGTAVHAALPLSHASGHPQVESLGWRPVMTTPRMLRGADIPWRPDMIWGIFGFAFG